MGFMSKIYSGAIGLSMGKAVYDVGSYFSDKMNIDLPLGEHPGVAMGAFAIGTMSTIYTNYKMKSIHIDF